MSEQPSRVATQPSSHVFLERAARVAQVEGTCSGRFGYIVCVSQMEESGKGVIREGTGFAQVLRPVSCARVCGARSLSREPCPSQRPGK